MKRFALILEASRANTRKPIDGCKRDAERFEAWLKNPGGGAWNNDEVMVIHDPWQFELDKYKESLDGADYAVVAFSGHGRIVEDWSGRRKQMITIGNNTDAGTEIDFDSLTPRAAKRVMSCDACREVHAAARLVENYQKRLAGLAKFAEQYYTRADYRRAFEKALLNAREGEFKMFSCSPNEYAGDDAVNGGFFTDALLSSSADWCGNQSRENILTVGEAFMAACPIVAAAARHAGHEPQNPVATSSIRTGLPFPFAVYLG
jgi:hypothetical protein